MTAFPIDPSEPSSDAGSERQPRRRQSPTPAESPSSKRGSAVSDSDISVDNLSAQSLLEDAVSDAVDPSSLAD